MARSVFITGATGVVGSEVTAELLRAGCSVTALVRAPDDDVANARMNDALEGLELSVEERAQLTVLRGDVCDHRFGFSAMVHDALARKCSAIIHAAASVRLNRPRSRAIEDVARAMAGVIELARRAQSVGRLQKVEIVSTVGVGGVRCGVLPERLALPPRAFHNSYEEAKAHGEDLAACALAQGVPITVHRPSMVVGSSRTGRIRTFQVFYHVADALSGARTRGVLPKLAGRTLDIVPVDYVARAIARSTFDRSAVGQVFHLASGPELAPRLDALVTFVRATYAAHGRTLPRVVPLHPEIMRFGASLVVRAAPALPASLTRRVGAMVPLLDYLGTDQSFATYATRRFMSERGIELPHPERYLGRVLRRYLEERSRDATAIRRAS